MSTKIEWVKNPDGMQGVSWNPIAGCSHASAGCKNCYAEKMAYRLKKMGHAKYQNVVDENGWTGEISFCEKTLQQPLKWKKPRTIFVCSMSDLFHPNVSMFWLIHILEIIHKCPFHTFIMLTKRSYEAYLMLLSLKKTLEGDRLLPLPSNVWFLVSCENQEMADLRIPQMLKIKEKIGGASVWGVSLEPLLGQMDICRWLYEPKLDWVIVGCESGANRRQSDEDWIFNITYNCRKAGVACFLKQMEIGGKLVKMPKLDGRVWDEMPEVNHG